MQGFKSNKLFFFLGILFLISSCNPNKTQSILAKDNPSNAFLVDSILFNGNPVLKVNENNPYGLTSKKISVKPLETYEASFWKMSGSPLTFLVAHYNDSIYQFSNYPTKEVNGWTQVKMRITLPSYLTSKSLKFFINNGTSEASLVDKLEIKPIPHGETNQLPDYSFFPLLHDVINDYSNIHLRAPLEDELLIIGEEANESILQSHGVQSKDVFIQTLKSHLKKETKLLEALQSFKNRVTYKWVTNTEENTMFNKNISIYADNYIYLDTDKTMNIEVNRNKNVSYDLVVNHLGNNYIKTETLRQTSNKSFLKLDLSSMDYGFYELYAEQKGFRSNSIPLIIQKSNPALVILAPVTTWHAYNSFGGKSFYRNVIDDDDVNFISTLRPINSVDFDSTLLGTDLFILKNIFDWFNQWNASIYPDYYLEKHPSLFDSTQTLVLAQHAEYFSYPMMQKLRSLNESANIISLGGNQAYWKVKWDENFTKLEVRKDGNYFYHTNIPGGLWRSTSSGEAQIFGVAYSDPGYATYAPYSVINEAHWLFDGTEVQNGDLFGTAGIDGRGLSGDETDKTNFLSPSNTVILAKGTNPDEGGGEIVYIDKGTRANFSCGSIACGSGLGLDSVFSTLLRNFMDEHH